METFWSSASETRCSRASQQNAESPWLERLREASVARPITPASERAEILAALAAVDYVVEFDEPFAEAS